MKDVSKEYVSKFSVGDALIDISEFSQLVLDYIYAITEHSLEGEVCPLIVSQLEQMYLGKDFKVEPHKVNQSGASSKEVGDIDVYDKNKKLIYSIEVKDKDFSKQDVAHAITKFRQADLSTSLFVYGKNVSFVLGLKYINPCFNYKFITSCSKFSLLPFARFFIRLR